MKTYLIISILFFSIIGLCADQPEKFSQIRIYVPDKKTLDRVWSSGIDFEGSSGKIGNYMEFVAGTLELSQLEKNSISYNVVIDDLSKEYQKQLSQSPKIRSSTSTGSMSGYYTYDEIVQQLILLRESFPDLITTPKNIGTSLEGRTIWAVKISTNPEVNDPNKPEVLYTALHHAREPEGMMCVLYYMNWLLDNYDVDSVAHYLVNNRQIWFIPVVNPDGYVYNEQIAPNGGGMWRKNRRDNQDGTFGVDLNRNYGTDEMWNSLNYGSSEATGSDTYRGFYPFSEPEVAAIDTFMRHHNIRTCLNYHTYGNYLVEPLGYLSHESPDSITYREFCFDMVKGNRYESGTDLQTVNYATRGNSDDYMYGDDTKPKTFAMTPEVGPSFWPLQSVIDLLSADNLYSNIYYSYVAGQYTYAKRFDIEDAIHDGYLNRGENFSIHFILRNRGLGDASNLQIKISTDPGIFSWNQTLMNLPGLTARSESQITFNGTVAATAPLGKPLQIIVSIRDNRGYQNADTFAIYLGNPAILFTDKCESISGNWDATSTWNLTSIAHSLPYALTESPAGDYPANANLILSTSNVIDLTGYDHAILKFWTMWKVEARWDFCLVEVSTNSGSSWISQRTPLSRSGSGAGKQVVGSWGFDGYTPGNDWIEQECDLTPYAGKKLLLRFRLAANGGDQRDGWYIDDVSVFGYHENFLSVLEPLHDPNKPIEFALAKNYPNPFNPITTFEFSIPKESHVNFTIYNLLGDEIENLYNGYLQSGTYRIQYQAGKLASGIYIYRLTATASYGETHVLSDKMVFVK